MCSCEGPGRKAADACTFHTGLREGTSHTHSRVTTPVVKYDLGTIVTSRSRSKHDHSMRSTSPGLPKLRGAGLRISTSWVTLLQGAGSVRVGEPLLAWVPPPCSSHGVRALRAARRPVLTPTPPTVIPQAKAVMPLFNELVDAVARDERYLEATLESAARCV